MNILPSQPIQDFESEGYPSNSTSRNEGYEKGIRKKEKEKKEKRKKKDKTI